uniref:Uncharacterized protein n=1 Tax=Roseihalotalea indica TaxID=2867963 RepID=A0AA49JI59_9BACT|nr:hypothetical protein K4G66_13310 [Tunicatimonas sp. TK19036]
MKYILTALLLFPVSIKAQLLTGNGDIASLDTIAVVEILGIKNSTVRILNDDYKVYFDKSDIYNSLENLQSELQPDDKWHKLAKKVSQFIQSNDSIIFTHYLEEETYPEKNSNEELTKGILWELACPLLNEGKFELIIDSKVQSKIIVSNAFYDSGMGAITYLSVNGLPFWICPPITID